MYENPPPPDDYEFNFGPIFFTYHRSQSVQGVNFIQIDRSLIHKSFLGYEEKDETHTSNVIIRGDKNIEGRKIEVSVNIHALKEGTNKNIVSRENLATNDALKKSKVVCPISQKDESILFPQKKRKEKRQKKKQKKRKSANSDDAESDKRKKDSVQEEKRIQEKKSLLQANFIFESDSDDYEKNKTKSSYHGKSHSKKSCQHRRKDKDSRSDVSNHDKIPYGKVGLRSTEIFVKKEIVSSDEESISSFFSKKAEFKVEVLSDEDDYEKNQTKSSKSSKKKYDDSRSRNHFRSQKRNRDFVDSRSRYDDSRRNYSDYSSNDDSRNRQYEDSTDSKKSFNPYAKREMKQEIKQEPGGASCYGINEYYCHVCKLALNNELIFSSHMAGKKHKKAERQLFEQDMAKSSVTEVMESQNFPTSIGMDRIELYDEESIIQKTCEDADLLILGLDFVREIRGYEDTKYLCDLCSAQCVANSIMRHLIGFNHQMNCLKEYCRSSYNLHKDVVGRNRKIDRVLKSRLEEAKRFHAIGRIRVFKDIKRRRRSPEPWNPHQPSTSRQGLDVQDTKRAGLKITDEDCLTREYSNFYCKVCDSHMNNYAMWESHARGKRHAKNKLSGKEGLGTNNKFMDAPWGTISHLEEMIDEQCSPNDIIVGLKFILESQGENGDMFQCFLCSAGCTSIDIIDHLSLKKHKTKYLEKMLADGYPNAINEISILPISEGSKEGLIDDECRKLMDEIDRGRPTVAIKK